MKFKHSKIKNTALIFEVLARKVVSDAMTSDTTRSTALSLIKKYFSGTTELHRELRLYRSLLENRDLANKSEAAGMSYLDMVLSARRSLDETKLREAKYKLIRDMKSTYGDEFVSAAFSDRFENYKAAASVYKLFEYPPADSPQETMACRTAIVESITSELPNTIINVWRDLPRQVRTVGFKRLLEKFNSKYSKFNARQKNILQTMIYDPAGLSDVIKSELVYLESSLKGYSNVSDTVVQIKLTEMSSIVRGLRDKSIGNAHVSVVLKMHELLKEMRNAVE